MKKIKRHSIAAMVIISLILVTSPAFADTSDLNGELVDFFGITNENRELISGAIDSPNVSVTDKGTTVTVKHTVADKLGVYVLFEMTAPSNIGDASGFVKWEKSFVNASITAPEPGDGIGFSVFGVEIINVSDNKLTAVARFIPTEPIEEGTMTIHLKSLDYYTDEDFYTIEGDWLLEWRLSYKDTSLSIRPDNAINLNGADGVISEITVSPLSMRVVAAQPKEADMTSGTRITLNFKDGSSFSYAGEDYDSVYGGGNYNEALSTSRAYMYCRFEEIIDVNDVESVTIGNITIPFSIPSSWAREEVKAAIAGNLVPEELQVNYTQAITRAEACFLAVRLYEQITGSEITVRGSFDDTNDINVQKMAGLGVVQGVGNGKFRPDDSLNREQAATILCNLAEAAGKPLKQGEMNFADADTISGWAADSAAKLNSSGIMNGVGGGIFAPKDSYTREQSIISMSRLRKVIGN